MAEISTDWTFQAFPVVRMENELLRIEVLPTFGGKIWTLEHRPSGRQFLWHHPRHRLRALPLGANYDDHFFGGFDELLPNDIPEKVNGEGLVDHGELWTTPLAVQIEDQSLVLSGQLPITPLSYNKRLRLQGSSLILDYKLTNIGRRPLDLLWKLHPALRITEGTEIIVPARTARAADPQWSRVKNTAEFDWQELKSLHLVPPLGASTEFLYLQGLTQGQCGLRHQKESWALQMTFPKEVFTSVWVFASFGGWRDLEVLILEPCTTPELSLEASAKRGQCLHLEPGEAVSPTVTVEVSAQR
jgi:Domain of unknown function (DUF5107)